MIRTKIIINITGFLLLIEGIFITLGIPFSLYYGNNDTGSLLISASIISATGGLLNLLSKGADRNILKRDGYIVVTLGWIFMSAFGAIPFVIHGCIPSFWKK